MLNDFWDPLAKAIDRLEVFPSLLIEPSFGSWVSKELLDLFAILGDRSDTGRWSSSLYVDIKTPSL